MLSHFKSEGGREPAADASPKVREVPAADAPATAPPTDLLSIPPSPPSRPEPFSTRARAVPPPTFLTPPPEAPSFPWLAVAAGLIAGIALGGVGRLPARHATSPTDGRRLSGGAANDAAAG